MKPYHKPLIKHYTDSITTAADRLDIVLQPHRTVVANLSYDSCIATAELKLQHNKIICFGFYFIAAFILLQLLAHVQEITLQ